MCSLHNVMRSMDDVVILLVVDVLVLFEVVQVEVQGLSYVQTICSE